jgi:hypothetical protein
MRFLFGHLWSTKHLADCQRAESSRPKTRPAREATTVQRRGRDQVEHRQRAVRRRQIGGHAGGQPTGPSRDQKSVQGSDRPGSAGLAGDLPVTLLGDCLPPLADAAIRIPGTTRATATNQAYRTADTRYDNERQT